jgi:hypothetical protein
MNVLDNQLVKRTTQLVIEEYIQDYPTLRLTKDSTKADIYVYPIFLDYDRPDISMNLSVFNMKTERVYLSMEIVFYHKKYKFYQTLRTRQMLEKEVKSNFYSTIQTDIDFAESMLFNLIKKTIDQSFVGYFNLLF